MKRSFLAIVLLVMGAGETIGSLAVNPGTRSIATSGGNLSFTVSSNTSWSWSGNAAWLTSNENTTQSGNQIFSYSVAANPSTHSRTATITITTGNITRTHTVTQVGVTETDHGDTLATATTIAPDSTTNGIINPGGDLDYFRIAVSGPGLLTVQTTGSTDTFGVLYAATGERLAENDDRVAGIDLNFQITEQVSSGTYYILVRHYSETGTGPYQFETSFALDAATLSLSPQNRNVDPCGGNGTFSVFSNTTWSWSDNATWLTSNEPTSQNGDQFFVYAAIPNPSPQSRSATITLTAGNLTRTYTVTQQGGACAQSQIGQDIDGEAAGDLSGYSVSLSADGNRVAIGAHWNDENGDQAGHVRIYELFGNTWIQLGQDIDGEAADDESGYSVSLSADGNRVAIGAPWNNENGSDAGHVRVYQLQILVILAIGNSQNGTIRGAGTYLSGTSATLTASPDPGYLFTGWTGDGSGTDNPLALVMDGNQTAGAVFSQDQRDLDADGLSNYQELAVHGTDPNDADSDGDGFNDGEEVAVGSDPNDAGSDPVTNENRRIPISLSAINLGPDQDALLLGFPSASGKFYRIEESEDLRVWSIREFRVPGTGENIQRFIPMGGPRLFLRVEEE